MECGCSASVVNPTTKDKYLISNRQMIIIMMIWFCVPDATFFLCALILWSDLLIGGNEFKHR